VQHLVIRATTPLRPFSDWKADVDRRLQHRTGQRLLSNEAPESYWLALYHCGESAYGAADEFVEDRRP
jgi:hypothetical protein